MSKQAIKLGMEVRDIVSGFTGTVVSKTDYLNGCVRFCVEPKVKKDGSIAEGIYVDQQQLEIVKATTPATKLVQASTGGARPAPRAIAAPKGPRAPSARRTAR